MFSGCIIHLDEHLDDSFVLELESIREKIEQNLLKPSFVEWNLRVEVLDLFGHLTQDF